jgi:hypothetical protein
MKTISFNKHAFIFYKNKIKGLGFPVEHYTDKQLKSILSDFLQAEKASGMMYDYERDKIVLNSMLIEIRDKKLRDLLS